MPIESLYCSLRQNSDQRLLIHRTDVFVIKGCTIFRKFLHLCLCEEMKHFSVVLFKLLLLGALHGPAFVVRFGVCCGKFFP